MRTYELEKELEVRGLQIDEKYTIYDSWTITSKENGKVVAVIGRLQTLQIDTRYTEFIEMEEEERTELFNILLEYSQTPIEERDPEVFYLKSRMDFLENLEDKYLNLDLNNNKYKVGSKENNERYQTLFTEEEIHKLDLEHKIFRYFTIENVTDYKEL